MSHRRSIKLPNGQLIDAHDRQDYLRTFEFQLQKGWTQRHEFHMASSEHFLVFIVEASGVEPIPRHVLQDTELTITRSSRPELRITLDLITVHDSVLEARLRRLEDMVDAILSTEMDEASPDAIEARMAQRRAVLRRLGRKPTEVFDHRKLTQPIFFRECERGGVEVRCAKTLPEEPRSVRVVLRGIRKLPAA